MADKFATVEEYIDSFPEQVRDRLRVIRTIAFAAAPGAGERISYGMAVVTLGDRDVAFYSGWKRHVAVYPVPGGDGELDRDLDAYRTGKGTLQFRHDRPLPEELVHRVIAALSNQRSVGTDAEKAPRLSPR